MGQKDKPAADAAKAKAAESNSPADDAKAAESNPPADDAKAPESNPPAESGFQRQDVYTAVETIKTGGKWYQPGAEVPFGDDVSDERIAQLLADNWIK